MKRYWKHAMAAATLAWASGNASAQPAPVGLPATQNANPQAVTPMPSIPPIPPVPSEPPQAVVPPSVPAKTVSTTQAPPLASCADGGPGEGRQEQGDAGARERRPERFGTAKSDPPPGCCPTLCCPAPTPIVCTDNAVTECFDNHEPAQKWHWEIGGGVYYVQPNFHTNPAFLRFTGTGLTLSTQQSDFRYNMQVAPLGWISYVSDAGWGIRGRYFQFDQGAAGTFTGDGTSFVSSVPTNGAVGSVFAGAPGDVADFSSRLRVEVWDLEGTYTFTSCRWNFLAAAGVRYANLFQSYDAKSTPAGGALPSSTSTVSSFNGAGPTFALESKYRFGESGFAVYGSARGSSVRLGPLDVWQHHEHRWQHSGHAELRISPGRYSAHWRGRSGPGIWPVRRLCACVCPDRLCRPGVVRRRQRSEH